MRVEDSVNYKHKPSTDACPAGCVLHPTLTKHVRDATVGTVGGCRRQKHCNIGRSRSIRRRHKCPWKTLENAGGRDPIAAFYPIQARSDEITRTASRNLQRLKMPL